MTTNVHKCGMENNLLKELEMLRDLMSGRQRDFYEAALKDAHCVICTPLAEVFTKVEIALIRSSIRPQKKECYRNAHLMTLHFPDVQYVEGKVQLECGIGIEHAFNRRGDRYFDITWELALHNSVKDVPYLSIGEYTNTQVSEAAAETGYYGDVFNNLYIKTLNNHGTQSNHQQR